MPPKKAKIHISRIDLINKIQNELTIEYFVLFTKLIELYEKCRNDTRSIIKRDIKPEKMFVECMKQIGAEFSKHKRIYKEQFATLDTLLRHSEIYWSFIKIYMNACEVQIQTQEVMMPLDIHMIIKDACNAVSKLEKIEIDSNENWYALDSFSQSCSLRDILTYAADSSLPGADCIFADEILQCKEYKSLIEEVIVGCCYMICCRKINQQKQYIENEVPHTIHAMLESDCTTIVHAWISNLYKLFTKTLSKQEKNMKAIYNLKNSLAETEKKLMDVRTINSRLLDTDNHMVVTFMSYQEPTMVCNRLDALPCNNHANCMLYIVMQKIIRSQQQSIAAKYKTRSCMQQIRVLNLEIEKIEMQNDSLYTQKRLLEKKSKMTGSALTSACQSINGVSIEVNKSCCDSTVFHKIPE